MGHSQDHPLGKSTASPLDHTNLGDVYNVKDFGAIGGGNDDTAAFLAVAAAVSATNGGTVIIPPDRYGISQTIRFTDIPALKIIGLGGKPFQGDKTKVPGVGGAVLE